MKNKKIIFIGIAILLIIIIITVVLINKKGKKIAIKETLKFYDTFELEDIKNTKYKIEKSTDSKIANKYLIQDEIYKLDANVKLGDKNGEMLYVRDSEQNLNIYQTKYRIDELDFNNQIEKYKQMFKDECTSYIGAVEEPKIERIYGEYKNYLPVSENIYLENGLYTITYELKDDADEENGNEKQTSKFDINIYRDGNYLMCEFVKIF